MSAPKIALHLLIVALLLATPACKKKSPDRHGDKGGAAAKPAPAAAAPALKVSEISFAGPAGHRPGADFARGEHVMCLFTLSNFTYRERKAHITTDIDVVGTDGSKVLRIRGEELIKGEAPTLRPGTIRTAATLPLPGVVPAGRYTVTLSVKDHLGGGAGVGKGAFTVLGTAPAAADSFTLGTVALAADARVPAGAVVPVTFEVRGHKLDGEEGGERRAELWIAAGLLNRAGKPVVQRPAEKLIDRTYPFGPVALPLDYQFPLPRELPPGDHVLRLQVQDKIGGATASASLKLQVIPTSLSVINLHVHDHAGLVRPSFLLGEQIFIRLSVFGLKEVKGQLGAAVDLAIASPHGDIYMAYKGAGKIEGEASRAAVQAGRFPAQLPLVLPTLAPTGKYRVVIRARDLLAGKEVTREKEIHLMGDAPKPMGSFKVDQLEVRERPDLPTLKGDTFGAGRTYHLALRVGGVKLREKQKRIYAAELTGNLRLRNLKGDVVHERKELFKLKRLMTYRPLRLVLPAKWALPSDLPGGLYDLEVSVLNVIDDRVSQLTRRVEVVGQAPAPEVKIP